VLAVTGWLRWHTLDRQAQRTIELGLPGNRLEVIRMKQCCACGGLVLLQEDGLRCYHCGKAVNAAQKRLGMWTEAEGDEDGDC
jgi:hypothetical protein